MKISRKELYNKYGINLPVGKYKIKADGANYAISTIKDDTSGCILVGRNKEVGKVLDSTVTFKALYAKLKAAHDKGESISIEIK